MFVRHFRTLKNKYDFTLCQSRLHTASKTFVCQKKIGSGSIFCVFASVACILIGKDGEYEKTEKRVAKISDSVCNGLYSDGFLHQIGHIHKQTQSLYSSCYRDWSGSRGFLRRSSIIHKHPLLKIQSVVIASSSWHSLGVVSGCMMGTAAPPTCIKLSYHNYRKWGRISL